MLVCYATFFSKQTDIIVHLIHQLIFRYAADSGIRRIHANISNIVQLAEYAELRELGDTGKEDEAEQLLAVLQWTIEVTHNIPKNRQTFAFMHDIEQRSIIFVYKHYHLFLGLLIYTFYKIKQSDIWVWRFTFYTETPLIIF